MLILQADMAVHICVNFCKVNAIKNFDACPIPHV